MNHFTNSTQKKCRCDLNECQVLNGQKKNVEWDEFKILNDYIRIFTYKFKMSGAQTLVCTSLKKIYTGHYW